MQQKNPLISVIIDNYNYARYLPSAINSVLEQNFKDYELIVVDDASTDHSRDIIHSYGEKVIPVMMKKNSGQGEAFYAGFKASKGELISFLDADDVFLQNKLKLVAKAAKKNPNAILIYHQGYQTDKDLVKMTDAFPAKLPQGNLKKKVLRFGETLLPPTSFLTFRRHFLEKALPLSPFLSRIDADYPLKLIALMLGEIVGIKEPLSLYRLHGNNWFSNNDFMKLDLDTLTKLLRRNDKSFYCVDKKLIELGIKNRPNFLRHPYHRRNLFIFNQLSWWKYLSYALIYPDFESWKYRWEYITFGVKRRQEFLRSSG